jgi:hypothetical protein
MPKLLFASVAALAFAVPAAAQRPAPPPHDPLADEIARALPAPEQIEAMAPALDRMIGAFMNVDVGPIMDAADPLRRHPGYGRRGRTIGALGSRDDPYFEDRIRSDLYGATEGMARMSGAMAAAAPSLARSLREMENALGAAIDDYHRGAPPPRGRRAPPAPRSTPDDPYGD